MLNILYIAYIYIYMVGETEIKITLRNLRIDRMVLLRGIKKYYGRAWTVLISLLDRDRLWAVVTTMMNRWVP